MTDLRQEGERLWRRAIEALRHRQQWSTACDLMTPSEAASDYLDRTGDLRLADFVQRFYYPQRYGEQTGSMSLNEAMRLITDLEGNPAVEVETQASTGRDSLGDVTAIPPILCGLCGRSTR